MLSRWLHRGGIGQMLAPDPSIREEETAAENDEFTGGIWNILAPDPNFVSPEKRSDSSISRGGGVLEYSTPTARRAASLSLDNASTTPPNATNTNATAELKVEQLVICAAKDLSQSLLSPPNVWEDTNRFFSFCASSTALNDKKLKKVKKMLKKDPSLATSRSSNMGLLVPNGFTPLHAAASVGNYEVALILLEFEIEAEGADHDSSNGYDLNTETDAGNENEQQITNNQDDTNVEIASTEQDEQKPIEKIMSHPVDIDARDIQGRTALHIASVQGHINLVQLLKKKMYERCGVEPLGENAPMDLIGRTPLGGAATSREMKARKNIQLLRKELFSPGDKSVYGENTPAFDRTGGRKFQHSSLGEPGRKTNRFMDLSYGFADMPGHRIEMEDAICHGFPLVPSKGGDGVGFFGVFDGHGDGGISSKFVADNIIPYFTSTQEWKEYNCIGGNRSSNSYADGNEKIETLGNALTLVCNAADENLKTKLASGNSVRHGGSTGVMSLITSTSILIGNIGDSRCVLVQKNSQSPNKKGTEILDKEDKMNELSLEEKESDVKKKNTQQKPEESTDAIVHSVVVKALSTDHTPSLVDEKTRIEKAGLTVIEETFQANGQTITLSKIQKGANDRIAVSRAFGDFDYKANEELTMEEQAIICTPEITIHSRDHVRDMYLILACDGVFDVMSNDEVGNFVAEKVDELSSLVSDANSSSTILAEVGDELLKKCLDLGSSDNMSVLIVALPQVEEEDNTTRALNFSDV